MKSRKYKRRSKRKSRRSIHVKRSKRKSRRSIHVKRSKRKSRRKYRANEDDDENYEDNVDQCTSSLAKLGLDLPDDFRSKTQSYEHWAYLLRDGGVPEEGVRACAKIARAAIAAKNGERARMTPRATSSIISDVSGLLSRQPRGGSPTGGSSTGGVRRGGSSTGGVRRGGVRRGGSSTGGAGSRGWVDRSRRRRQRRRRRSGGS